MREEIIKSKYLLDNEDTAADMFGRIAYTLSKDENSPFFNKLKQKLADFKYIILGGSNMSGIGNPRIMSLSNCFVIESAEDNYESIIGTDLRQTALMKIRGGVGHALTNIRPKGYPVNNAAQTSTGIVPFMARYSNATREVAQDGRRGALMLSIDIRHPEALNFIGAKMNRTEITGANVSVQVTDDFMRKAQTKSEETRFIQLFPVINLNVSEERAVYAAEGKEILLRAGKVRAKAVKVKPIWDKLVEANTKYAEPGILFWDTILNDSPAKSLLDEYPHLEETSTNPCGEIPLNPNDSCRLLHLNVYAYILKPFTKEATFDTDNFYSDVTFACEIMDAIIDLEIKHLSILVEKSKIANEPETKKLLTAIKKQASEFRRMGIGLMGVGDAYAALGLDYGNVKFNPYKYLNAATLNWSVLMAKNTEGRTLPVRMNPDMSKLIQKGIEAIQEITGVDITEDFNTHGVYNIGRTTMAPTGTTSLLAEVSSGGEPVYSIFMERKRKVDENTVGAFLQDKDWWVKYNIVHKPFELWYETNRQNLAEKGIDVTKPISLFSAKELNHLITLSPYRNNTALTVPWLARIQHQALAQQYIDHSISSTVNLPADTKEEEIADIYIEAWQRRCKGLTIYVDGSRGNIISDATAAKPTTNTPPKKSKRPKILDAKVHQFKVEGKPWVAFVGLVEGKPFEIFTGEAGDDGFILPTHVRDGKITKSRTADKATYSFSYTSKRGISYTFDNLELRFNVEFWNLTKMTSVLLQSGAELLKVIKTLESIKLEEGVSSWKAGMLRTLKAYVIDGTKHHSKCKTCGHDSLVYTGGCYVCQNCGESKC